MRFCPKCKSLMMPSRKEGKTILKCSRCGYEEEVSEKTKGFVEKVTRVEKKPEIVVWEGVKVEVLPKTRVECPRCHNLEAYWWTVQTRAADEPPTRFYRCTKCGYTWREYE